MIGWHFVVKLYPRFLRVPSPLHDWWVDWHPMKTMTTSEWDFITRSANFRAVIALHQNRNEMTRGMTIMSASVFQRFLSHNIRLLTSNEVQLSWVELQFNFEKFILRIDFREKIATGKIMMMHFFHKACSVSFWSGRTPSKSVQNNLGRSEAFKIGKWDKMVQVPY